MRSATNERKTKIKIDPIRTPGKRFNTVPIVLAWFISVLVLLGLGFIWSGFWVIGGVVFMSIWPFAILTVIFGWDD
jgi:hypothetical protein